MTHPELHLSGSNNNSEAPEATLPAIKSLRSYFSKAIAGLLLTGAVVGIGSHAKEQMAARKSLSQGDHYYKEAMKIPSESSFESFSRALLGAPIKMDLNHEVLLQYLDIHPGAVEAYPISKTISYHEKTFSGLRYTFPDTGATYVHLFVPDDPDTDSLAMFFISELTEENQLPSFVALGKTYKSPDGGPFEKFSGQFYFERKDGQYFLTKIYAARSHLPYKGEYVRLPFPEMKTHKAENPTDLPAVIEGMEVFRKTITVLDASGAEQEVPVVFPKTLVEELAQSCEGDYQSKLEYRASEKRE
jgi:hypothetical protein